MVYKITSGILIIIDDADLKKIQHHRYYLMKRTGIIYRSLYDHQKKHTVGQVGLAHDILNVKSSRPIIHINGDKRDFRKSNLKVVKPGRRNIQAGLSYANTSGFRGVSRNTGTGNCVCS